MLALLLAASAAAAPASPAARLPLKALVLYENGVGYFERRGDVREGQVAEIPLEPGQLDDALKSLVLMSSRGVASVEFAPPLASEAARAVAGLPEPEEQRSLATLVRALQGVDVQVLRVDGTAARGRVVEVTEETTYIPGANAKGGEAREPVPDPTLVVFGEAGLAKMPLRLVQSVRPLDGAVALAWSRAMGAAAVHAERQALRVRGAKGAGAVSVGYTTEAAVWRTTYRLVLNKQGARLQGFALVHNDSDEAWEGVAVTLASGRPTSFLFPMAGPRYGRRELVSPEDGLDAAPQLATREARGHLSGSVTGDTAVGYGGLGLTGTGSGGGGYGMGVGAVGARGSVSVGASSVVLEDGPTPLEPAAVSEAGDLFLYRVAEPVFLGPRKSALLPIVDSPVKAERVTVLAGGGEVLTGVRLLNSTSLTLEGGTLSVFVDGAYAGETQLDRLKPREVRVLTHGQDLDVQLTMGTSREQGAPRRAAVTGLEGQRRLELGRVDRLVHTVSVTSRADAPRTVLVALPEERFRVEKGAEEDVRSPGQPRFGRFAVKPREEKELQLVEEGAVTEAVQAQQLTTARLGELLSKGGPEDVKKLLTALKAEVQKSEAAAARAAELDARLAELERDIARQRENLTAMGKGGATSAAKAVGERLLGLEDELSKLRAEQKAARRTAEAIRRTLLAAR